jgi:SAP domain-containing ribonucleoprotein
MQKLKSLKVAELKDLLAKAAVSFPSKATKSDLVAKVSSSPAALQLFNDLHNKNDDLACTPVPYAWPTKAN